MDFRTTLGWVLWQHLLVGAASEVVAGAFGAGGVPPVPSSCFWCWERSKGRANRHLLHSAADACSSSFCSPIILRPEKAFSGLGPLDWVG